MAATTTGVSTTMGFGGLIFLISDFFIVLGEVKLDFPMRGPLIAFTYVLAQYIIISEWSTVITNKKVVEEKENERKKRKAGHLK